MLCLLLRKTYDVCDYDTNDKLSKSYFNLTGKPILNPINNTFIKSNPNLCRTVKPYLIVIIPSLPEDVQSRNAIRFTYGTMSSDKFDGSSKLKVDYITRIVFLLGRHENIDTLTIDEEYQRYQDIVQIDIIESYYNLTQKILLGLKWISLYCSDVKYILKVDTDVFVNIVNLFQQIHQVSNLNTDSVYGKIFNDAKHLKVLRTSQDLELPADWKVTLDEEKHFKLHHSTNYFVPTKWTITYEEYPLCMYPPYAQGTSYTLTGSLAKKIVESAKYLPYLHIEDVFITGIIAGQIHRAKFYDLVRNSNWGDYAPDPCLFVEQNRLSQTKMTPHLIIAAWSALNNYDVYCSHQESKSEEKSQL
ncbi:UDP-GalNAc beta-1 [Mactra antiquata]